MLEVAPLLNAIMDVTNEGEISEMTLSRTSEKPYCFLGMHHSNISFNKRRLYYNISIHN